MTHVLVTGATGYIGGRLVPQLLAAGYEESVYVRSAWKLRDVPWREWVHVIAGDLSDAAATRRAMTDIDVAFYLVHSMSAGGDFVRAEKKRRRPSPTPLRQQPWAASSTLVGCIQKKATSRSISRHGPLSVSFSCTVRYQQSSSKRASSSVQDQHRSK